MNLPADTLMLGRTGIRIPPLGIGAWAWGDRLYWGYGRNYSETEVRSAFHASLEAGINFFDTAESYGRGKSERLLGELIHSVEQPIIVATKFMPYPWRLRKRSLLNALRASLERLRLQQVDLYQIHFPFPPVPVEVWAEALADAVERGLARAVGVSNYNEEQMRRAFAVLQKHGVALASNQVEYNLLNRKVEFNNLLKACRELEVTLIAYSPLAQGILTGKYSPEKPPPRVRGLRYNHSFLNKIQPLIRQMRTIAQAHGGKTLSQVALNWVICKGAVPIPGAKNERQALDNAGALGWQLTTDEVATLDRSSREVLKN